MLEEVGRVIEADKSYLIIETERKSSCSHCSNSNCGTSVLANIFPVKKNRFRIENNLNVKKDEMVVLGVSDEILVLSSLWAYFMPLVVMISFAITSNLFEISEVLQSVIAIIGLITGLLISHQLTKSTAMNQLFKPQLLRRFEAANMISSSYQLRNKNE